MMRPGHCDPMETIWLGSSPADEPCPQLGDEDYEEMARATCKRYMDLIRSVLGPEPLGCHLRTRGLRHDFGEYFEVVVEFDPEDRRASEYAYRCDSERPVTWDEAVHHA